MKKFIFLSLLLFANIANAATFNATTGTGTVSNAELVAVYGTTMNVSFTYCQSDYYPAVVQYKNIQGVTISKSVLVESRIYTTVRAVKTANGYDLVGYGVPNRMSKIPAVGDGYVIKDGAQILGTLTSVGASPTSAGGLNSFHGLKGWKTL